MSKERCIGISVLVGHPFPFAGVGMSCANILGLKMLQLAVDVVSIAHVLASILKSLKSKKDRENSESANEKQLIKYNNLITTILLGLLKMIDRL